MTCRFRPRGASSSTPIRSPTCRPSRSCATPRGALIVILEKTDITKLVAAGWQPPMPITVKARDGVTDLHGLLYTPTHLDTAKKYPIVNHIYPGPQTGSVGGRTFNAARGDAQALAQLGFVVVEIDGMGTPWRSKKFHEAYYGNMGDNTLPDQVAGMKELASRYPWIDIDRAGIYGHSGGGYAAAHAMFRYPDFFKVGVSQAGNHDNRVYEDDWAEKWQGLLEKKPDGTTNYDNQANQLIAKNLKGRLLLAHGTMDANVPPNNTLLVVDALIKANKDFDLLMFPNRGHGFGNEAVHGAAALGLFREASDGGGASAGVRTAPARDAKDTVYRGLEESRGQVGWVGKGSAPDLPTHLPNPLDLPTRSPLGSEGSLDDGSTATQQAYQEQDDRNHEQHVDERANRVRADHAQQPRNQQDDRKRVKHV